MKSHRRTNSFDPTDSAIYHRDSGTFLMHQKNITVDDMRDIILPFLQEYPDITILDFYNNNFQPEVTKLLTDFLQSNTTITSLIINDNNIDDESAKAIATLLTFSKTLKNINLAVNDIGEDGAKALANTIKNNATLIEFNLAANPINDQGALALYHAKRSAPNLQELMLDDEYAYLSDNNINTLINDARRNFGENYSDNFKYPWKDNIQGITFRHSIINSHNITENETPINARIIINILIPYFNTRPEITALHFDEVEKLDVKSLHALITLMQSCKTVKSIKIFDFNPYGYSAMFALKEAAKAHSVELSLPFHYRDVNNGNDFINRNKSKDPNTLDLSSSGCENHCNWDGYFNIISQDIIDFIIPHLQAHPNITTLILDKNSNISDGIIALAKANTNLTTLSVNECCISSAGMQALAIHNKFVHLNISGNFTEDNDLVMIVQNNPKLKTLKAKYAVVGNRQNFSNAVKIIAESQIEKLNFDFHQLSTLQVHDLAKSKTIKILNLHSNKLTDDSLISLANNEVIMKLNLSLNKNLTDAGLRQYLINNRSLISLNLKWVERAGDLTAIALAQHPSMQIVNLEECNAISETGIRALSTNQRLKKIHYKGYHWDNEQFFPLLAENDPGKNTILPKEKLPLFYGKFDRETINNLFKVPTLFCLAGVKAKHQTIKKYSSEFTIQIIENSIDHIDLFLTTDMDPKQMKQNTIYICDRTAPCSHMHYTKPGYQYQLLGEDGKIKRGIIYQKNLSIDLKYHGTKDVMNDTKKFLPELLKHIIDNGHISLFSVNRLSHDVQEQISQYKY